MIFGSDRNALRKMWFEAYRKSLSAEPLIPLEKQLTEVIGLHPEYHKVLANPEKYAAMDYLPEFGDTNPFLHMSLHMGLREQLANDRPAGIQSLFAKACLLKGDKHDAEHVFMEAMAEAIWQGQREGKMPDEQAYLAMLTKRLS